MPEPAATARLAARLDAAARDCGASSTGEVVVQSLAAIRSIVEAELAKAQSDAARDDAALLEGCLKFVESRAKRLVPPEKRVGRRVRALVAGSVGAASSDDDGSGDDGADDDDDDDAGGGVAADDASPQNARSRLVSLGTVEDAKSGGLDDDDDADTVGARTTPVPAGEAPTSTPVESLVPGSGSPPPSALARHRKSLNLGDAGDAAHQSTKQRELARRMARMTRQKKAGGVAVLDLEGAAHQRRNSATEIESAIDQKLLIERRLQICAQAAKQAKAALSIPVAKMTDYRPLLHGILRDQRSLCGDVAAADRGDPGALRRSILKLQNRKTLRERHRLLQLLLSESYVFLHKSPPCVVWDVSIMLLLLYVIVMVPIFIGFDWDSDEGGVVYTIGMIIDIFFLVDVAINFNLSFTDEFTKETVEDRRVIVRRYLSSWFLVDLMSSIPVGDGSGGKHEALSLIKTLRILKLMRVARVFRRNDIALTLGFDLNPAIIRLSGLLVLFFTSTHVIGCAYWFVAKATAGENEWGAGTWLPEEGLYDAQGRDRLLKRYCVAVNWAIACMLSYSTLAAPGEMLTVPQYLFSFLVVLCGLVTQAAIIGGVTNLIESFDERANERRKQLEALERWMMYQRVPLHLQGRVRDFHEYLLECGHTRATDEHLRSLPQSLRENLNLSLRRHLIEAVPLFRALTTFELMELLHAVDTRITVPGEVVVRAGTSGDEMYFVARGQVDILDGDRSARIATLGVGARAAARNS